MSFACAIKFISVPSNGPMPLQYMLMLYASQIARHFSTLKRAYASAMLCCIEIDSGLLTFQYPQTGLCLCNLKNSRRGQRPYIKFQYPQTGLCLCNATTSASHGVSLYNFSTLKRAYASAILATCKSSKTMVAYFSTLKRAYASAIRSRLLRVAATLNFSTLKRAYASAI